MAGYDDRDGFIWMDGKLVEWRSANVHILTHALHYASSVFEGERCYNGKIFKGHEHSLRLLESGRLLDMPIPYTAEEIDAAKEAVLKANGLTDAYIRAVAFRGAGDEMGVASLGNPVRLAGEDSRRGTFSQRHAALVDNVDERVWIPLSTLPNATALPRPWRR